MFNIEKYRNLQIEAEVLGICMSSSLDYYNAVSKGITIKHFYSNVHQALFKLITETVEKKKSVDVLLLLDIYKNNPERYKELDVSYITTVSTCVSTKATLDKYVEVLTDYKINRDLSKISKEIDNSELSGMSLLDKIQSDIISAKIYSDKTNETKEDKLMGFLDVLEFQMTNPDKLLGANTGYHKINKVLGGLQKGHIGTVLGRSGLGKTTFITSVMKNLLENGTNVLFFSMEMPFNDIIKKMVSNMTGIEYEIVKNPHLASDVETEKIVGAVSKLRKQNFDILSDTNVNTIISKAMQYKMQHGLDVLILDYLNIATGVAGQNTDDTLNKLTRSLKEFALNEKVHVIMLCQCNREVDKRPDKRPIVADIKDSSSIEQNSDYIIGLYRNLDFDDKVKRLRLSDENKIDYNSKNADYNPDLLEVNFLKNRYGARERILLKWEGNKSRAVDLY